MTDYPDEELIRNLRYNIEHSAATEGARLENIVEEGYLWGNAPTDLIKHLPAGEGGSAQAEGFDVLILADLLFNHSEHRKLVVSLQKTMKRTQEARALVFFTPHRPWLFERDMAFFELAREVGFVVEKVLERRMEEAVLARGPVRRSIHEVDGEEDMEWKKLVLGYELRWKEV